MATAFDRFPIGEAREQTTRQSSLVCGFTRENLEKTFLEEEDSDVRRRMLLALKVKFNGIGQDQAARDLNSKSSWATKWIKRSEELGIEG